MVLFEARGGLSAPKDSVPGVLKIGCSPHRLSEEKRSGSTASSLFSSLYASHDIGCSFIISNSNSCVARADINSRCSARRIAQSEEIRAGQKDPKTGRREGGS